MTGFQDAMLTLARIRNGGKQTVVVQHVAVGDGGQAVIAGKLTARGRKRGGSRLAGGAQTGERGAALPGTTQARRQALP